jgi:hypothetical protein
MTPTLVSLVLAAFLAGEPTAADKPRFPNPLAPSLPQLTADEEQKLDDVIDRFAQFDTGQLRGEEGKTALRDFDKLGPESIPALIRGLNKAAVAEQSCPTLVIAKKLNRMLMASDDGDLLEFARDNIAAGVERSRHMNVLQDLRVACSLRQNALARRAEASGAKTPHTMSTADLVSAAAGDKGTRLKVVLMELDRRKGPEVLTGFTAAAAGADKDGQKLALDLMDRYFAKQPIEFVQQKLKDDNAEVRKAAARAATTYVSLIPDVIDLLADGDAAVTEAAHQTLVKLNSGGEDYGPSVKATKTEVEAARQKWQSWWQRQKGK